LFYNIMFVPRKIEIPVTLSHVLIGQLCAHALRLTLQKPGVQT
jgi:hypothetical protein